MTTVPSMRDRAILDASMRLFYERGYDGVGVDEIGAASGVSGPAIYRHFKSKDEILATLFDEAMDRLLMLAGVPRDDPIEDLRALARAHAEFALDDRELLSVYAREDRSLEGDHRRRLHRRQRQFVERWRTALARIDQTLDDGELTSMAYALIGMLISAAHWPREALSTPHLVDLLAELCVKAASGSLPASE
jgi:AcrR family transcriptional regulator